MGEDNRIARSANLKQLLALLVRRIDAYQERGGRNDKKLSEAVTGGRDFVRDLRRGEPEGRNMPRAHHLFALGRAMGLVHGADLMDSDVPMPWDAADWTPDDCLIDTRGAGAGENLRAVSDITAAIVLAYMSEDHPIDPETAGAIAMEELPFVLEAGDDAEARGAAIRYMMARIRGRLADERTAAARDPDAAADR